MYTLFRVMRKSFAVIFTICLLGLTFVSLSLAQTSPSTKISSNSFHGIIGISEPNPAVFTVPQFQTLGIKHARIIVPYDVVRAGGPGLSTTDAWLATAATQGVEPLVVFERAGVYNSKRRADLPTKKNYLANIKAFLQRYPSVHDFITWNEANHYKQPTYRHPERVAQYYKAFRGLCPSCTIVATDVLDQAGMEKWVKRFNRAIHNKSAIWGLNNYGDVNRFRSWKKSSTRRLLHLVHGPIWIVETGGITCFSKKFSFNLKRAARATQHALDLGSSSSRIQRIYFYNWFSGHRCPEWDSGFVNSNGSPRPALGILSKAMQGKAPRVASGERQASAK